MNEVGTFGNYQKIIILIFFIVCLQTGLLVEGNPYLFAVAPYTNCPNPYIGITLCTNYACSKHPNQRAQF